ncbi:MAG: tetratricopeptide repeat protein, partial [Rhodospirillaceae bacterium]|nr:tetratricopeptide repeat protein [Rhodospirillaceae bacterium]
LRYTERYAEAVVAYDAAVARTGALVPRHWFLLYSRGVSLERTKEWARAEADFLQALELSPDQPLVLNYLGYSWLEQGMHLERAQAMIEKAVSLRPNDGYIVDSLGWAFYRLGDYDRAVRQLERAVELMPNDPVINDHLGDALRQAGRRLEARFQWTRSIELGAEEEAAAIIRRKLSRGLQAEADADDDAS